MGTTSGWRAPVSRIPASDEQGPKPKRRATRVWGVSRRNGFCMGWFHVSFPHRYRTKPTKQRSSLKTEVLMDGKMKDTLALTGRLLFGLHFSVATGLLSLGTGGQWLYSPVGGFPGLRPRGSSSFVVLEGRWSSATIPRAPSPSSQSPV